MNDEWQAMPEKLELLGSEVHVFKGSLEVNSDLENHFWKTLAEEEKKRADRFHFPIHRAYFIAGRGILRQLLGQYLNVLPQDLQFEYGPQGKPFLTHFPNFKFNISHSKHHILLAFSKKNTIGIDVEVINSKIEFDIIAPRFFSKNEATTLLALPISEQPAVFYNCWTRKEAFIKAKGAGLSFDLTSFSVSIHDDFPQLLRTQWNPKEKDSWKFFSFVPQEGYFSALCVSSEIENVSCFDIVHLNRLRCN